MCTDEDLTFGGVGGSVVKGISTAVVGQCGIGSIELCVLSTSSVGGHGITRFSISIVDNCIAIAAVKGGTYSLASCDVCSSCLSVSV